MKTQFEQCDSSLCVTLSGSLEGELLDQEFWEGFRQDVSSATSQSNASELFWDVRALDYVDSLGLYYLLEVAQEFRRQLPTRYVGPGAALQRLDQLGQAPHLSPMLTTLPWESEPALADEALLPNEGEVPTLLLDTAEFSRLVGDTAQGDASDSDALQDVAEDSSEDFVIDLSLEQARLESGSDRRDFEVSPTTLAFKKSGVTLPAWQPKKPQIPHDYAPDPARMLLRDDMLLRDEEGAPSLPATAWGAASLDSSALEGVGELLRMTGVKERENRELRSRCFELEQRLSQQGGTTPEAQRRWQELSHAPLNAEEQGLLQEEWLQIVRSFQNVGRVEPQQLHEFCNRWDPQLSAATSYNLGTLDHQTSPAQRWRALSLFGSTLNREDWPTLERRMALSLAVLATLVDLGPGREPSEGRCARDLEDHLGQLAFGRSYGLADYYRSDRVAPALSPEELASLWRGCVALAQEPAWGGDGFQRAFGRSQARFQGEPSVLRGLQRVLAVHSRVLPGSWVELSSGQLGVVLGAACDDSSPRVLVLFQEHQDSWGPTSPYLFPRPNAEAATLLRVIEPQQWAAIIAGSRTKQEEPSLPVTEGVSA